MAMDSWRGSTPYMIPAIRGSGSQRRHLPTRLRTRASCQIAHRHKKGLVNLRLALMYMIYAGFIWTVTDHIYRAQAYDNLSYVTRSKPSFYMPKWCSQHIAVISTTIPPCFQVLPALSEHLLNTADPPTHAQVFLRKLQLIPETSKNISFNSNQSLGHKSIITTKTCEVQTELSRGRRIPEWRVGQI